MKSHISAVRAITAEFARQFIRPFVWIAIGILLALLALIGILAFLVSEWWLLLLAPTLILAVGGLAIWVIVRLILKTLSPHLNIQQENATKEFVGQLQHTIETIQTPYPVIIFFIIRDIILRRDTGFISEVTQRSKTLKPEFEKLRALF